MVVFLVLLSRSGGYVVACRKSKKMILPGGRNCGIIKPNVMSTLVEIEAAADSLSSSEKEELLRFLAMRLRDNRAMPKPRIYSDEELSTMLSEDEGDGERFRQQC